MRIVNADPQQVLSAVMRIPRPSKTAVAFTGLGLATLGYAVKSGTSHMRTPAQIQWFGQTQTPTFKKYVVEYATSEDQFFADFAVACQKLFELGFKQ